MALENARNKLSDAIEVFICPYYSGHFTLNTLFRLRILA